MYKAFISTQNYTFAESFKSKWSLVFSLYLNVYMLPTFAMGNNSIVQQKIISLTNKIP